MTKAPAAPSTAGTLLALLTAEAHALVRNGRALIWTLALPLLVLFIGESQVHKGGPLAVPTLEIVALALTLSIFTLGLFGYATVLATYRERGVFQRMRCAPVPAWQILGARLLVQMLAVLLQAVLLFGIAWAVYGVAPSLAGAEFALLITILAGLASLAIGQVIVAFVGTAGGVSAVARVLLIVLMLLDGFFFRSSGWPSWLRNAAQWTPIHIATRLMQDGLVGTQWGAADLHYLLGLVAWIAILAYLGIMRFRWQVA